VHRGSSERVGEIGCRVSSTYRDELYSLKSTYGRSSVSASMRLSRFAHCAHFISIFTRYSFNSKSYNRYVNNVTFASLSCIAIMHRSYYRLLLVLDNYRFCVSSFFRCLAPMIVSDIRARNATKLSSELSTEKTRYTLYARDCNLSGT